MLEGLTEAELRDVVVVARGSGTEAAQMTDSEVLMGIMRASTDHGYWWLHRHLVANCKVAGVVLWVVANHPRFLVDVPEDMRGHDVCMMAVRDHGFSLEWVPGPMRTRDVCLEATRRWVNGTYNLCMRHVRDDPEVMGLVPEPLRASIMEELGLGP